MSDPILVTCPEGQWTKVATDIGKGAIYRVSKNPGAYLFTYRDTGEAAPTDKAEGVELFINDAVVFDVWDRVFSGVDVYIWADNAAGSVRADMISPEIANPSTVTFQDIDASNVSSYDSATGLYSIKSSGTFVSVYWSGALTIGLAYDLVISELTGTGEIALQAPVNVLSNGLLTFEATNTLLQIRRNTVCDVTFKLSVRKR